MLRNGILVAGRAEEDSSQSQEHYQHVFSSRAATHVLISIYS